MRIAGAIFDMDGTLLDSMPVWDTLGAQYLTARGKAPRPGLRADLAALSMAQTAQYLIDQYGIGDPADKIIADINGMVADFYLHTAPLKRGAARFLDLLGARGVRLCLATATDRPLAEGALRRLGVWDRFSVVLTCSEVGAGKDRPDIYFRALHSLGVAKEEALVFEDALHAIQTAKAAGFRVAAMRDASMAGNEARIRALADLYLHEFDDWREPFD